MTREARPAEVVIPFDPVTEQLVLAAAVHSRPERKRLLSKLKSDHFLTSEHRPIWEGFGELERRNLDFDLTALARLAPSADVTYVAQILEAHPASPPNLNHHIATMLWDHARHSCTTGPLAGFLDALKNPREAPDKVRSLARSIALSFDGYEERRHLHDPAELVREQMADIEARIDGRAFHPFGLEGLDYFEGDERRRRMLPGAAPGLITTITGVSGAGKSTITARLVLGLARQRKHVLYGSWEMRGGTTLELLACLSLGWSRSELTEGKLDRALLPKLEERMAQIGKYVRFMGNPFGRVSGERASNERNLDILQGYIADSGCEVFVGDLWKRCLRKADPEEEELALIRQQSMLEEMRVHGILIQQQRLKDIEQRPDKRPTREGIKGSSAWVEVSDNIIGVHRPALWKNISDDVLELDILKQRYGKWPLAIEFGWDADKGAIDGGSTIAYAHAGEESSLDEFVQPATPRRRRGRRG